MAGKRDDLEIIIGADLGGLAADLARGVQMHKDFARNIERAAPKSSDLAPQIDPSGFNRATSAIKGTGLSVRSLASELVGFGAKVAVAGGALVGLEAGLNGVGAALELVKSSVVMAAEFEQNQIAFEAMLGSAKEAAEVMADLRKFAAETPFGSKEVTQGARQLLAYGFAVDELIPSLKTIGTLAAASSKPLGELVYNVGTTKVQGRAMQLDINQLTDKGIDVYPGLAKSLKVDQVAVRKLVEEGRVDWNTYKSVLEDLAKTRFSGLLEKQANSLKGSWEQLTDAFDRAKLKLGQVIAQEAGLRGAARDLEGFAGSVERALDSDRFRGSVRFTADLAKGGAQVAYEFGRAGLEIARINLDGLTRTSPELAQLAKHAQAFAASLKDFKLDKRAVAGIGVGLFESIAYPLADAIDWVKVEGRGYANEFKKNFIDPINDAVKSARDLRQALERTGQFIADQSPSGLGGITKELKKELEDKKGNRAYFSDRGIAIPSDKAFDDSMLADAVAVARAAEDLAFFNPPLANEPADNVKFRYRHLEHMIDKGQFLAETSGWKQFQPYVNALRTQRGEFFSPYSADPGGQLADLKKIFDAGQLPPRRADWKEVAAAPRSRLARETVQELARDVKDSVFDAIGGIERQDSIRGHFGKMFEDIRKNELVRTFGSQVSVGPLGPLGGLAPALTSPKGRDLYLPSDNRTPSHLVDLAGKLNEQFNPGAALGGRLAELNTLLDKKLISDDVFQKARDSSIRDVADKMGLNQPSHLPDTVLAGSQEDARLLAQAMGGNGRQNSEDLLRQIMNILQRTHEKIASIETAPSPRPVSVAPAGGG